MGERRSTSRSDGRNADGAARGEHRPSDSPSVGGHPDLVEAIARRVAELLRADLTGHHSMERWVSASEIARRFGVSRTWVYENADALGALRIGGRSNNRLRFDSEAVRHRMEGVGSPTPATTRRPAAPAHRSAHDLLPIRQRPSVPGD